MALNMGFLVGTSLSAIAQVVAETYARRPG